MWQELDRVNLDAEAKVYFCTVAYMQTSFFVLVYVDGLGVPSVTCTMPMHVTRTTSVHEFGLSSDTQYTPATTQRLLLLYVRISCVQTNIFTKIYAEPTVRGLLTSETGDFEAGVSGKGLRTSQDTSRVS